MKQQTAIKSQSFQSCNANAATALIICQNRAGLIKNFSTIPDKAPPKKADDELLLTTAVDVTTLVLVATAEAAVFDVLE